MLKCIILMGNCIGRFQLANEVYINKTTNEKTSTEWHNLVVRNKAAEMCEKYLSKVIYMLKDVLNRVSGKQKMVQ
jgi:hypothetical protein